MMAFQMPLDTKKQKPPFWEWAANNLHQHLPGNLGSFLFSDVYEVNKFHQWNMALEINDY